MAVAPSPEEKFEDNNIAPKGNAFLTEDASPASAKDTAFHHSAATICHFRGDATTDTRLNIHHHSSSCSFPDDYEKSRQRILPYPDWITYCHQPQGFVVPQPPSSYFCPTPYLFGAFVSPNPHCCGIFQGCNAQHQCGSGLCTPESPSLVQSLVGDDRHSAGGSTDTGKEPHNGLSQKPFACTFSGCKGRFRRQKALNRHILNHLGVKPYTCWVHSYHRKFSRRDNLNAHYLTHRKHGGRNSYVATLDPTSPVFNLAYRGRITPEGWPLNIQWAGPASN